MATFAFGKTVVKTPFDMKVMNDIADELMTWYDANHRVLPWRETTDPYAVWVSEIILQQTRVAQGYDYYLRFLRAFPDVQSLAAADEDEVLRVWQGLGYYSRARNMQAAARQVVEMGGFPATYEGLLSLKGVGDYTAAAIGSFAFGLPVAVVDGNVYRILTRLFAVDTPIDTAAGKREVAELASHLLPADDSAHYNQAVMDFGALQCVPHNPDCASCPLADKCLASGQGRVEAFPVKSHKTKVSERYFDYFFIHDDSHMYLHKRQADDIWRGLYELPLREVAHPHGLDEVDVPDLPFSVSSLRLRGNRKHVLSHQIIHASLYEMVAEGKLPAWEDYIIIRMDEREKYAFPRLIQLLLE